jgi:myosin heavy subunit
VLQQQFNQFVFEAEQAEYASEHVAWAFVDFPDNKLCIEMVEATKPVGILALLDEQTVFPNATDATLCAKLHAQIAPNHPKHFGTSPELKVSQCFVVHHYAGSIR